jgi:aminopeptidase N
MKKFNTLLPIFFLFFTLNIFAQTKADTIHVLHYNINLEIRNFAQKEIDGFTDVIVEAKIVPLSCIYLHFMGLTVDSIKKGNDMVTFSYQGEQLRIDLQFQQIGQPVTIRVFYHGAPVKEQWGGFYFVSDCAFNMGVGIYSFPHPFGRVWFPCIDEFTDKSTYSFKITTDADKKAVCGGILTDSVPVGNGIRWTWELTDPIPTYLASVAVGKYLVYKDTVHSISGEILPVEIYADSATIGKVPGSFVNLKTFIHTYEKCWGVCRWQRVGYVAVPFSQGAMEHASNIAYPRSSIDGNTASQDLIAHELAHSWFGNLITCSTSQNMWINEGFARYGEYLCMEILDPTLQKYKTEIKKLHFSVLRSSVCGKYALDNVPTSDTYNSSLVYDKGGVVAYTLRNYMGDERYFSSITRFFDENQYANVNSEEFFQKLSAISEMNLMDFFEGWVHQPGFLNFNIDSITPVSGSHNKYDIAFKQKLYLAQYFADNNKIDVEFLSESGEKYWVENISFSGEHEIVQVELPFEPVFWCIDPNSKMGDACFDYTTQIFKTGPVSMSNTNFSIEVEEISDTSILRVEHNPVASTSAKNENPDIVKISEKHFWRIGFLQYDNMQATFSFLYDKNYDEELLQGYTYYNLILLYRKDASQDWQIIPATVTVIQTGSNTTVKVSINSLLSGEYTFGIGNILYVNEWEKSIEVFPNPTTGELRIELCDMRYEIFDISIFDMYGRKIPISNLQSPISNHHISSSSHHHINISHLPSGAYLLEISSKENKVFKKIIKL